MFLVSLPGKRCRFDEIRQARGIDEAVYTGVVNSKCIATDQGYVVWQTGMADGIMLGEQGVFAGIPVEIWHIRIADDRRELLIFKDQDGNWIQVGDQWGGCRALCDRGCERGWYGSIAWKCWRD